MTDFQIFSAQLLIPPLNAIVYIFLCIVMYMCQQLFLVLMIVILNVSRAVTDNKVRKVVKFFYVKGRQTARNNIENNNYHDTITNAIYMEIKIMHPSWSDDKKEKLIKDVQSNCRTLVLGQSS
mmetsp:Transcript_29494/g.43499  ORF Transcript_29494/g.43499 Transcript_29494/m.43499 type:complete len:123 (-) Transcript_29494:57-425(-)